MENKSIVDILGITMENIREMVDVNTIVGEVIHTPDGTTIIPVSRVSFGFGTGGTDFSAKDAQKPSFGGGGGAGVGIVPVAFLVVTASGVRLLPVSPPAGSTVDRLVEMVPTIIDKIEDLVKRNKE